MTSKHILILGTGSAGKRHAANLASLGCRISCMDPRSDRLDEARAQIDLVGSYTTMDEALNRPKEIDGVAVTSPPVFHVDQSMAALERISEIGMMRAIGARKGFIGKMFLMEIA